MFDKHQDLVPFTNALGITTMMMRPRVPVIADKPGTPIDQTAVYHTVALAAAVVALFCTFLFGMP